MAFNNPYSSKYLSMFNAMEVNASKVLIINGIVNKINSGKARYQGIAQSTGVPWFFIGVVHYMEANCNFTKHLHNGDPLSKRTVQVPANRPLSIPPFTFEQSAIDALTIQGLTKITNWSIPNMILLLENYNGAGYRNMGVDSPYLWSFSNLYTKGKFVADHKYDPNAVSKQAGAAVILKVAMIKNNLITAAATAGGIVAGVSLLVLSFFF